MSKPKLILAALSLSILIVGISTVLPAETRPALASATQASDKYDADCSPTATAGRCADKCPDSYYQQGMDKETGALVCKPNGQTDPSQTNPKEARSPAQATAQANQPIYTPPAPDSIGFRGK